MRGIVLAAVLLSTTGCGALFGPAYNTPADGTGPPQRTYAPLTTCAGPNQTHVPSHGELVHMDFEPRALEKPPPIYPQVAKEAGVDGTVILNVLVCARGGVADARVSKSIPMLDAAALDAVTQWYWRPAEYLGQPIAVWTQAHVEFVLPQAKN